MARAQFCQPVVHRLGRVGGRDRRALGQQHGAGVESFVHAHGGDAGLSVSREDGAMDGRRAAPARQQRAVDIDAPQHRRIEKAFGQDVAVGDDHGRVEIERLERLRFVVAPQALGRAHRQAERQRALVHRRAALLLAATGGLGRARVDGDHVVTGVDQRAERRHGEFGSAEKAELHRRTL